MVCYMKNKTILGLFPEASIAILVLRFSFTYIFLEINTLFYKILK